jgi:hypothetical protein
VTAYVPIQGHTRAPEEYAKLGDQLRGALGEFTPAVFYEQLPALWLTPFVEKLAAGGHTINHSQGDNPAKNSMEYHAVQHNKFEWLEKAAMLDTEADVFVWLDYGCMRLPGFDSNSLTEFLRRVRKNDLAIPGCWEKKEVTDYYPCWRFCGTLFIVPRQDVFPLNKAFKAITRLYVRAMRNVTWEVNDLARMELVHVGPKIRWYPADHNATMLTGYGQ